VKVGSTTEPGGMPTVVMASHDITFLSSPFSPPETPAAPV